MQQLRFEIDTHTTHITFHFNETFEQEDLQPWCQQILPTSETLIISETLIGADRLSCRFNFQQQSFQCHFEVYSQSCWIEAEYPTDEIIFKTLAQFLKSQL